MSIIAFQLSEPLPFIHKDGLTSGYVEEKKGIYKVTDGNFRQLLKKSQYDQLMAANILSDKKQDIALEEEGAGSNQNSGNDNTGAQGNKIDKKTTEPKPKNGQGNRIK